MVPIEYTMGIRVRVPELLTEEIPTAYALAKASDGRISTSAATRLVQARGAIGRFDAPLLEALADVFKITDYNDLFERKDSRPRRR
jgi:hypothetical protein